MNQFTRDTLALVLAGGQGTRLKQLTRWRAKPAVPFGGKFRIIDFALSNCINSGIRCIDVLIQYKSHSLISHVQKGWSFLKSEIGEFIELIPAQQRVQDQWYAGTADAVYQNLDIIKSHRPRYVLVLAGDHIYKMDYSQMLAFHVDHNADMTVGCVEVTLDEARRYGVMSINDEDKIIDFNEKPAEPVSVPGQPDKALASMGIYVFNTDFLCKQLERDGTDLNSSHDFGKDIIPTAIANGQHVVAYPFAGQQGTQPFWRDVGTVDAFWESNMDLIKVSPELNLYDSDWPIWTYQAQLPPAKFVFDDEDRRGMAVDSMISGGCIVSGATVRRSLIFSNVKINSFSKINDSVILPEVKVGRNCRLQRVVVDEGCELPDGLVVGEDIQQDRERFHVTDNGIVLVTAEMLGQYDHYV
jgi:glucose-1-phosphate adenylyltransferase